MSDDTSELVDAEVTGTRIRGYAHQDVTRSYFDIPLFTQLTDNLWVGGTPAENPRALYKPKANPEDIDEPRFDKILCLYPWEPYQAPEGTERVVVKMYDSMDQAMTQVDELAATVAGWLDEGHTVLVHCQAGLNRSNLLAARTLTLLGMRPSEAIALIREKRSKVCLCNQDVEACLLEPEQADSAEDDTPQDDLED